MKHKTLIFLISTLFLVSLALAACGGAPASNGNPALPAAPAAEGGGGGEGGGGAEGSRGPTLTNPGGLPAAPEDGNANSQLGEERMLKIEDPSGQFSILLVDGWTQEPGSAQGSLRSAQGDWVAEVGTVSAGGKTPEVTVQALDTSQANGASGYQKIALQTGDVNGLPAASLIYQYDSGTNPVTGKALRFIASEVFIGGGPKDTLGHITFSAPYAYYGDVSEIFDKILAGFTWK